MQQEVFILLHNNNSLNKHFFCILNTQEFEKSLPQKQSCLSWQLSTRKIIQNHYSLVQLKVKEQQQVVAFKSHANSSSTQEMQWNSFFAGILQNHNPV